MNNKELRDYFAIHWKGPREIDIDQELINQQFKDMNKFDPNVTREDVEAELRYRFADAMVKVREK